MTYINHTTVEVFAVGRGGDGGAAAAEYVSTGGGGGGGSVHHFSVLVPDTDLMLLVAAEASHYAVWQSPGYATMNLVTGGFGGNAPTGISDVSLKALLDGASGGGAAGHVAYYPVSRPGEEVFALSGNFYGGGKGSQGGHGGEGETLWLAEQVLGWFSGGGGGATGDGGYASATGCGNGGPGVQFDPLFTGAHTYWMRNANQQSVQQMITGFYAAGGASGQAGSWAGPGGADAPPVDGPGVAAISPGCGGSGASNVAAASQTYYGGSGGNSLIIVKYPGLPRAELRERESGGNENNLGNRGNTYRNYTYYRNGHTYHVLAGDGQVFWKGSERRAELLLSPLGLPPEDNQGSYAWYADNTAPAPSYGIWKDHLWKSTGGNSPDTFRVIPAGVSPQEYDWKGLTPQYFAYTANGQPLTYESPLSGSFFEFGFVVPSRSADDAAVVTKVELDVTVSQGAVQFEVWGVPRHAAHAQELNGQGAAVLLASTVQTPENTGFISLDSFDSTTAFKKIWLRVTFGVGASSGTHQFAFGSSAFKVFGYPA